MNPIKDEFDWQTLVHLVGDHAEFPPSKLEQFEACPLSWKLSQGIHEDESEAAREGTLLHRLVAYRIADCLYPDAEKDFTTEQLELADACVAAYNEIRAAYPDCTTAVEESLALFAEDRSVLTWGTADCFGVGKSSGFVIDFKFGFTPVTYPSRNLQILTYAAALCQRFKLDEVECWIVQPRLNRKINYTFNFTELGAIFIRHVAGVISRCKDSDPEMHPGEKQCRYCPAKGVCEGMRKELDAVATVASKPHDLAAMDIHDLARFYEAGKTVSVFIDSINDEFRKRLEAAPFDGYELKRTGGGFKCPSPAVVFDRLQDVLTPSQMIGCCTCTLTKVKAAYADAAVAQGLYKSKKAAAEAVQEELADVLVPNAERVSIVKIEKE